LCIGSHLVNSFLGDRLKVERAVQPAFKGGAVVSDVSKERLHLVNVARVEIRIGAGLLRLEHLELAEVVV